MIGFDDLKKIAGVLQEAGKIEQYQQILEAQAKMLEMQNRILDLEAENRDLKNKLDQKANLSFERGAYWMIKKDGTKDGPFCSRCQDVDGKLVRMKEGSYYAGWACCQHCNKIAPNSR